MKRIITYGTFDLLHHSATKFLTPYEVHSGLAEERIINRVNVYKKAYVRYPERWSGKTKTRNWAIKEVIFLNPPKGKTTEEKATNAA